MSDDEKKTPGQRGHLRSVGGASSGDGSKQPHAPVTRLPPDQEKILFMRSQFVEWTPFAKSLGLNPRREKPYDEFKDWAAEKRLIIAREQSEEVGESLFRFKAGWHANVLKTLTEYPESADAVMALLQKRTNDIVQTVKRDAVLKKKADEAGEVFIPEFSKIKTSELTSLALAMKVTTELKHKALMLDHWSLKEAELFTDPRQFETKSAEDQSWNVSIMGMEGTNAQEIQKAMMAYYDNQPATIDVQSEPLETS